MRLYLLIVFMLTSMEGKISPSLERLGSMRPKETMKLWVFFTDKGTFTKEDYKKALSRARRNLTPRARQRRLIIRDEENLVSFSDLPVRENYIREIEKLGAKRCEVSRWLNGATFEVQARLIKKIERLSFVREIKIVRKFKVPIPKERAVKGIEYGGSKKQLQLLGIDKLHSMGYTGKGVFIGIMDTGFRLRHPGFTGMRNRILNQWDFISNDSLAQYDPNDTIDTMYESDPDKWHQWDHGTEMLSLIGARAIDEMMGAAFGADIAFAKTELLYSCPYGNRQADIVAEEGWWIAGVEWAESLGVDIISSSLGYKYFWDSSDSSYGYSDMDGKTTLLSQFVDSLISKNVLLVTAMGNVSGTDRPDTCIVTPADAESILAVGGVDTLGNWAWRDDTGSAIGPTFDGRIKPDVCGPWTGYVINPNWYPGDLSDSRCWFKSGTSIATALVAGACACVLEAHKDTTRPKETWSAAKLREAILETASQHASPDDTLGYGVVRANKAVYYTPPIVKPRPLVEDKLLPPYPSPFKLGNGNEVTIPFQLVNNSLVRIYIFTLSGRLIKKIEVGERMIGFDKSIKWNGKNSSGEFVGSGIYICLLESGYGKSVQKLAIIR